jgi:hypothetical protein
MVVVKETIFTGVELRRLKATAHIKLKMVDFKIYEKTIF